MAKPAARTALFNESMPMAMKLQPFALVSWLKQSSRPQGSTASVEFEVILSQVNTYFLLLPIRKMNAARARSIALQQAPIRTGR